jgi:NTP pyrophosphatase (non-canonical NTP hydrolase)
VPPTVDRLLLVSTSPRVAPGVLTWDAWQALRSGPVWTADADHPQLPALAAAGIEVSVAEPGSAAQQAAAFRGQARGGVAVWLAGGDGDERFLRALADQLAIEVSGGTPVELEVVAGSYDLPGARLLDAVAVMDRLRSPGGCPWDAQQTHQSLGKYLLEEAYEAYEAIEDDDAEALREEMGDVLLQVLFHARLAQEAPDGWSIDDAAGDLVDKLVNRHPHVFGDEAADSPPVDPDSLDKTWDRIKAVEKGRLSVTDGVPLGQPALSLAAKLQRRALRGGLPHELLATPGVELGDRLFALVAETAEAGSEAEAELRAAARRFRDRVLDAEAAMRASGVDPAHASADDWRRAWPDAPVS